VLSGSKRVQQDYSELLSQTRVNLEFLNERIEQLDRHQYLYDLVGIGLTALGLVLALLAVLFFLNMRVITKHEAKSAASAELADYLGNADNVNSVIESWLDANRSELAARIAFTAFALQDHAEMGGEIANAWSNLPHNNEELQ
jgi:hypothetical protein